MPVGDRGVDVGHGDRAVIEPWLRDPDVTLWHGDCLSVLRTMPDRSVHMVASSPPFYGLRDYGTGSWEGGEEGCDHKAAAGAERKFTNGRGEGVGDDYAGSNLRSWTTRDGTAYREECGKCGARRVDQQIGLEASPDEWVERLVEVYAECRRVLRDDGVMWVEIGDSYTPTGGGAPGKPKGLIARRPWKPKDLLGQPWMLAFALRADGWYLRSEVIWHRPNPMPESIGDRPTKAHSTVFLLSKSPRYFYDADAIRQPFSENSHARGNGIGVKQELNAERGMTAGRNNASFGNAVRRHQSDVATPQEETLDGMEGERPRGPDGRRATAHPRPGVNSLQERSTGDRWPNPGGANARTVWSIPTEPTSFKHFATWPTKLIARMIQAGTSEKGCCPSCGAPWRRVTDEPEQGESWHDHDDDLGQGQRQPDGLAGDRFYEGWSPPVTLGWERSCSCVVLECGVCDRTTHMSAVHDGVHAESEPDEVLLEGVRESTHGREPDDDEGVVRHDEGVSADPGGIASYVESGGLRDGAPARDGGAPRADADEARGGASRERGQDGQPDREPAPHGEAEPRPDAEAEAGSDPVSALRGDDPSATSCPGCGGSLTKRVPDPVPCVILDPFMGSGTTALVARNLGRHAVGIELNEEYLRIAGDRLAQQSLFA